MQGKGAFKIKNVERNLVSFGVKQLLQCDYLEISDMPTSLLSSESFIFPTE